MLPFDHGAHVNGPWLIHTKLQARLAAYLHVHAVDGDEEPRLVPGAQLGDGVSPPHVERPVRQAEALQNHLAPLDPVPPTTQSNFSRAAQTGPALVQSRSQDTDGYAMLISRWVSGHERPYK